MSLMRFILLLTTASLVAGLSIRASGEDDPLPNFNAPQDNSPLDLAKVNRVLGINLFEKPSLWDEDDIFVSKRLAWPEESRTSTQSSFRLYPTNEHPVTILGAQAYSCVLYGARDRPTEVSIVFANEGDYEWGRKLFEAYAKMKGLDLSLLTMTNRPPTKTPTDSPLPTPTEAPPNPFGSLQLNDDDKADLKNRVQRDFEQTLKHDAQMLKDALSGLFGDPAYTGFGGGSETREQVKRWDWQGHAFLLSAPRNKYVTLRIVPTAFADNYGKADNLAHEDLKALLLQRVKQLDSGDIVVSDIPMVDQGPKGYCVPATWERYLRYLGIPADMYVLAMAAGSSQRGTNLDAMVANVDSLVTSYHRRIDGFSGDLDMKMIAANIDKGLPLMWTCSIHGPFEKAITNRKKDRSHVTDWGTWGAQLAAQDEKEIPQEITGQASLGGHQRMIIGYNLWTNEIAISDSWSTAYAIRWITLPEANAINSGHLFVIEP